MRLLRLFRSSDGLKANVRCAYRNAAADLDRYRIFAKELVELRPDVILAVSTPNAEALVRATRSIPIVFTLVGDPLASLGWVEGRNIRFEERVANGARSMQLNWRDWHPMRFL